MASSVNDDDTELILRVIDDSDGIVVIAAAYRNNEVRLNRVEVAPDDRAVRTTLVLDEDEMDKLAIWWRNRRIREQAARGGYPGAP